MPGYRHHPIFTNTSLPTGDAEAAHRDHAIIEAVIADLKDGPLAHAPSGKFTANAAWLALAAIALRRRIEAESKPATASTPLRTSRLRFEHSGNRPPK